MKLTIKTRRERSVETINAVVSLMGSKAAAARALKVAPSTVYRWINGELILEGIALVAARAVIVHPEDYQSAKKGAETDG